MIIGTWRWYQGPRAQRGVNQLTYIQRRKGMEEEERKGEEKGLKREECEVDERPLECYCCFYSLSACMAFLNTIT
jgi:hypothetical protein